MNTNPFRLLHNQLLASVLSLIWMPSIHADQPKTIGTTGGNEIQSLDHKAVLEGKKYKSAETRARFTDQTCLSPLRAELYRDGWVDFNKNGVRDPYEDPSLDIETRVWVFLPTSPMRASAA